MTDLTVLTLEPLDFNALGNTLKLQLRGEPCKGHHVVKVDYPASFNWQSIDKGVAALDRQINLIHGPKLVFGHSQGAQVASRWLRQHAKQPSTLVKPHELSFLFIGNPLRKYGGYIVGRPEVGGQIGQPTPNDSPYLVTDVTMQYDGWSDWPGDKAPAMARMNATAGKNKRHCYGYLTADLNDPNRKTYQEGTTTYVLLPGKPNIPVPQQVIERAYHRPER